MASRRCRLQWLLDGSQGGSSSRNLSMNSLTSNGVHDRDKLDPQEGIAEPTTKAVITYERILPLQRRAVDAPSPH